MLSIEKIKELPNILTEHDWDLKLLFNDHLLDVCNTTKEEKQYLNKMADLVTRCKIDSTKPKIITLDYLIPENKIEDLAKTMTQLVTSALIQSIFIQVLNRQDEAQFSLLCTLKTACPDWHITFGTKSEPLKLICEYEIESIKLV